MTAHGRSLSGLKEGWREHGCVNWNGAGAAGQRPTVWVDLTNAAGEARLYKEFITEASRVVVDTIMHSLESRA